MDNIMKDKPWFKFTASNWLSGSVQLLSDAEKGTYIDLVSMIWKEGGQLESNKILARKLRIDYATACDRINSYCELDIMVCENDILSIKFLDEQLNDIATTSKKNSENAAKRWEKKPKKCDPMPIREEEREKREEIDKKEKKIKRFVAPLVDDIRNYCIERKNNVDCVKFFNFYESKGWMVGKNKMKDWKAAVRTWEDSKDSKSTFKGFT